MAIHSPEAERKRLQMIDVALLCALPLERDALLRQLEHVESIQDEFEPLTYYRGSLSLPATSERYEVVLVLLLGMGNEEAAISTVKVIERWQPAAVLLVGIAGGVRGKVALGDVVVADFVYYYELAKHMPQGQQRLALHFPTDRLLYGRARTCETGTWSKQIALSRSEISPDLSVPTAHFGAIGSGEKVIADAETLARLLDGCPGLLAVAMEGAGVARAAAQQAHPPAFLEIRGICDYADEHKNDCWQPFAAEAASAFTIAFLRARPIPPAQGQQTKKSAAQRSLLVLCAQSLRAIAPTEILETLHQKHALVPTIEHIALDWTDLVVQESLPDPAQAVDRLVDPEGALRHALRRCGVGSLAFYGLAHIPLAFLTGSLVTDRFPVELFDFHPEHQNWTWPDQACTWPPLEVREVGESRRRPGITTAVIRVSVSYAIAPEQTRSVIACPGSEWDFSLVCPQRSVVRSEEQVRAYGSVFRRLLDDLTHQLPDLERMHVFYAGPVALAFHLGQQISANIHPALTVWNFHRGYDWGIDLMAASLGLPCVVLPPVAHEGVLA